MLYLLDADTLIRSDRDFYRLKRWPVFWRWLSHMGAMGSVKIPLEQFEEVTVGRGLLVDWLKSAEVRGALLLGEASEPRMVNSVIRTGYGGLNEIELEMAGRDPFLIAYAAQVPGDRTVVSFEVSAPHQKKGKRKIPDACRPLGVPCCNLFAMIEALDFTTDWRGSG